MKTHIILSTMVIMLILSVNASADIRCLDTDEQAVITGGGLGEVCQEGYVSDCANACYSGVYRSRANKAGSCVYTGGPYNCWSTGSVVTCRTYTYSLSNCSGLLLDRSNWYGPSCDDDT